MNPKMLRGQVKAVDAAANPNGEFEVVLSAPTLDRDGEIVDAKAFEPLPDHITFDIDHGLSTATTVGSGTPFYEGDLLKVRGTFSSIPRAQEVRTLVTEGHIRTTSVAFMTAKDGREVVDGVPHVKRAELLNGAFVPVPANREAMVLSAKVGARNSGKDAERLQTIHDLSVDTGALCDGTKSVRRPEVKMMVGSFEERQEELQEAVSGAYPDAWWVRIIATFDDRCIYEVSGGANDDRQFEVTYSWDGDEVTLGTATEVEVSEVATPVPAGDVRSVGAADVKDAVAGETREDTSGAGGDDEQQHLELRARALRLLMEAVT